MVEMMQTWRWNNTARITHLSSCCVAVESSVSSSSVFSASSSSPRSRRCFSALARAARSSSRSSWSSLSWASSSRIFFCARFFCAASSSILTNHSLVSALLRQMHTWLWLASVRVSPDQRLLKLLLLLGELRAQFSDLSLQLGDLIEKLGRVALQLPAVLLQLLTLLLLTTQTVWATKMGNISAASLYFLTNCLWIGYSEPDFLIACNLISFTQVNTRQNRTHLIRLSVVRYCD